MTALRTESPVAPCAKHTRDHEQCVAAAKQALLGCGWCEKRRKVRSRWERRQTEMLEIVCATFQLRSRIQQVEEMICAS